MGALRAGRDSMQPLGLWVALKSGIQAAESSLPAIEAAEAASAVLPASSSRPSPPGCAASIRGGCILQQAESACTLNRALFGAFLRVSDEEAPCYQLELYTPQ